MALVFDQLVSGYFAGGAIDLIDLPAQPARPIPRGWPIHVDKHCAFRLIPTLAIPKEQQQLNRLRPKCFREAVRDFRNIDHVAVASPSNA